MDERKILPVFVALLSLSLIGSFAVNAAELKVPESYSTIQSAVDAASSGDTVLIAEGNYDEVVQITKNGLTLKAAGSTSGTVLNGTVNIESSYGTVIDGLTITGAGDGIRLRGNCRGGQSSLTVKNSSISGNLGNGIDLSHGASYMGVAIENNSINDNGGDGVNLQGIGNDVVVSNNEINGNGAIEATGVGVRVGGRVRGTVVKDNTIEDNEFANIHPGG